VASPIIIKAPAPSLSPKHGDFTEAVNVRVGCPLMSDCKIYYTTDGSEPTQASLLYTGKIAITSTGTVVKARSMEPGKAPSDVVETAPLVVMPYKASFVLNGTSEGAVAEPGGKEEEEFAGQAEVHLRSRTPGAQVHYVIKTFPTEDQDPAFYHAQTPDPSMSSPVYQPGNALHLAREGFSVIKAFVTAPGMAPSPISESDISILSQVGEPEVYPMGGGPYSGHVRVEMKSWTQGSEVFYTLNGDDPSAASTLYVGPFTLSTIGETTVRAIGIKEGLVNSPIVNATFSVLEQVATPVIEPDGGMFVDAVSINISCATEGAKIRYSINGPDPNAGSDEFISSITLGLGAEGREATYVVKAIATLYPHMGESEVAVSRELTVQPRAESPVFGPEVPGPYENSVVVSIESVTPGATIYYTTNGEEPTIHSAVYAANARPVLTVTNSTVRAKAWAPHMAPSLASESVPYEIEVSDPVFKPDGGEFEAQARVAIECNLPEAVIHYTLDNTLPSAAAPIYSGPITVGRTGVVVKAIALHPDLLDSQVVSSSEFIVRALPPTFQHDGLVFTGAALIHVSSATPGASIRCTLDGTEPTAESPVCESPISVTTTGTRVKAVATRAGLEMSHVASMPHPVEVRALPPVLTPTGRKSPNSASTRDDNVYINEVLLGMSCEEPGCIIHYVQGAHSTPSSASLLYSEPLLFTTTGAQVRAVTVAEGKAPSTIADSGYLEILADAATFSANGTLWEAAPSEQERGDFVEQATVTLETTTPNAVIVYTTDGVYPNSGVGIKYTAPIVDTAKGQETLIAVVFAEGKEQSLYSKSPVYDIVKKCPPPRFHPDTGHPYVTSVLVSIPSYDAGRGETIFYTTDGSTPTELSERYTGPFDISAIGTTVVKAFMASDGRVDSDVATATFEVLEQLAMPTIDVLSGTFTESVTVHLACASEGARIRYTTDGSKPNAASREYVDGITLGLGDDGRAASYTVKAIAMDPPVRGDSRVLKSGVIVVQPQVATPRISPDPSAGPFVDKVRVTMSCATPLSSIYYTTDGSDANTSDTRTLYDGPFFMYGLYPDINSVKAVAEAAHMSPSAEASATFVVKKQACTPSIDLQQGSYIVGMPVTIQCHGGEPADVYYSILFNGEAVDESEREQGTLYDGPFTLNDEGNVTIAAIAMADDLVSSPPVVSPQVCIEPEPTCAADEYELGAGSDRYVTCVCVSGRKARARRLLPEPCAMPGAGRASRTLPTHARASLNSPPTHGTGTTSSILACSCA